MDREPTRSDNALNADPPTPSTICLLPITLPHYSPDGSTHWHLRYRWEKTEFSPYFCLYFSLTPKCGLYFTHAHPPTHISHWDKALTHTVKVTQSVAIFKLKSKHALHKVMAPNVLNLTFLLTFRSFLSTDDHRAWRALAFECQSAAALWTKVMNVACFESRGQDL